VKAEIPKPTLFFLGEDKVNNCPLGEFSIDVHWFLDDSEISLTKFEPT
jgi:hypothetical protein